MNQFFIDGTRFTVDYFITLPIGNLNNGEIGFLPQYNKKDKQRFLFFLDKNEGSYEKSETMLISARGKEAKFQIIKIQETEKTDFHSNKIVKIYGRMMGEPQRIYSHYGVGRKMNLEIDLYNGKRGFAPEESLLYLHIFNLDRQFEDQRSTLSDYSPGCLMPVEVTNEVRTFRKIEGRTVIMVFVKLLSHRPVCHETTLLYPDFSKGTAMVFKKFKSGSVDNALPEVVVSVEVEMAVYKDSKKNPLEVVKVMKIFSKDDHVLIATKESRIPARDFESIINPLGMHPRAKALPELPANVAKEHSENKSAA